MLSKKPLYVCIGIALLTFVLDQAIKLLVLTFMHEPAVGILPHFNLILAFNTGAAFGMFASAGGWQIWGFIAIAIVISIVILLWSKRLHRHDRWENIALGLVLGGAWGNLLDRVRYGHVVDFIDFYIGSWHWYTFNVADCAICVGAAILIRLVVIPAQSRDLGDDN